MSDIKHAFTVSNRLRWIIRQLMDEARRTSDFSVKKDLTHTAHQLAYQARAVVNDPTGLPAAEAYLDAGINVLSAALVDRAFTTEKEIK